MVTPGAEPCRGPSWEADARLPTGWLLTLSHTVASWGSGPGLPGDGTRWEPGDRGGRPGGAPGAQTGGEGVTRVRALPAAPTGRAGGTRSGWHAWRWGPGRGRRPGDLPPPRPARGAPRPLRAGVALPCVAGRELEATQ